MVLGLTRNWTQIAAEESVGVNRMSRKALMCVDLAWDEISADDWDKLENDSDEVDYRKLLDSRSTAAVTEIERRTSRTLEFRDASVGRGAGGFGAAVEIIGAISAASGASAAVGQAARLVRWAYRKIANTLGHRPMISLGAAEYLAMADLIDRVGTEPKLFGSGDMCSDSPDPSFTGGDAFFVVLATESELHHYHITAYGEVHYIGTSPLIPNFMDAQPSPPDWAGGDASEE